MKVGAKAPAFSLKDHTGKSHSLKSLAGKFTVVYFYPKDDTPGCTVEALEFNAQLATFKKLGVSIIGISGGDEKTKAKFCKKHSLTVPLLSDTDFAVSKAYGVYGEKSFMGRKFMGINRVTFVLDASLKVVKVFDKVTPKGHAEEVLSVVRGDDAKKGAPAAKTSTAKATPAKASATKAPAKATKATAVKKEAVKKVPEKKVTAKKVTPKKAPTNRESVASKPAPVSVKATAKGAAAVLKPAGKATPTKATPTKAKPKKAAPKKKGSKKGAESKPVVKVSSRKNTLSRGVAARRASKKRPPRE